MITKEYLEKIEPQTIFQQGIFFDDSYGIKLHTPNLIKWVAVKGGGYHDWAIYADHAYMDAEEVARKGIKINKFYAGQLVNGTEEAHAYYRI